MERGKPELFEVFSERFDKGRFRGGQRHGQTLDLRLALI